MKTSKSVLQSVPETVKDSSTETDTSQGSRKGRSRASRKATSNTKTVDSPEVQDASESQPAPKVSRALGLEILTVPGGLYKVKNRDGGIPPLHLNGTYNELKWLQDEVAAYNKRKM